GWACRYYSPGWGWWCCWSAACADGRRGVPAMNLRTTLVLAVLAAAGVGVWLIGPQLPERLSPVPALPPRSDAGTLEVFEQEITPDSTKRLEVFRGSEPVLTLERGGKDAWVMPGGWPTRDEEIKELVNRLTVLRSRFAPLP